MIALATWVSTVLSRLYPGGQGDRRAFHCVVYVASGGLLYVLAMLFLTPALSSYLIFNLLLFVTLFLFGYLTQAIPGVTYTMQIVLLATVGAVGLNAQEPVTFQSISGVYFGVVLGIILSALVQRLLWPVLPQWQVRDRVIELLRLCRSILQFSPEQRPHWLHQRLALIPGEATNWIAVMDKWDCPEGRTSAPSGVRRDRCAALRETFSRPPANCFPCCQTSRRRWAGRPCIRCGKS